MANDFVPYDQHTTTNTEERSRVHFIWHFI